MLLRSLTKIDVDELAQGAEKYDICKIKHATSDGLQMGTGASSSAGTPSSTNDDQAKKTELRVRLEKAILGEQLMPGKLFKLACGHIFCEKCLRKRIADGLSGDHWPTCLMCEAALEGVRDVKVPAEAKVIITLDELRALAKWLGPSALNKFTYKARPVDLNRQ